MLGLDVALAVEQCVEEREADRVRFGAGADRAGEVFAGLGELRVGVPPQLARGGVELDMPSGLGVFEDGREVPGEAGVLERVRVAAFRQQTHPSDRGEHEPVHEPVGELDPGGVVAKLAGGDVPDDRDVSVGGACGRVAGQKRERPPVPRGAQCWRQG